MQALRTVLDEADGFNVSGVYFGEEKAARSALDAAKALLARIDEGRTA